MGVTRKIGKDISMLDKKINFPFESEKIIQVARGDIEYIHFQGRMYVSYRLVEDMDETQKLIKFL